MARYVHFTLVQFRSAPVPSGILAVVSIHNCPGVRFVFVLPNNSCVMFARFRVSHRSRFVDRLAGPVGAVYVLRLSCFLVNASFSFYHRQLYEYDDSLFVRPVMDCVRICA